MKTTPTSKDALVVSASLSIIGIIVTILGGFADSSKVILCGSLYIFLSMLNLLLAVIEKKN